MNPKVESVMKSLRRILLLVPLVLDIGAIFMLLIHENPLEAYVALFRGAFMGKLKIGITLANLVSLLLTSIAFAMAAKTGAFNVGVKSEMFLGGVATTYVGAYCIWLPRPLLLVTCFAPAVAASAAWVWILGFLRAYYGISEMCATTLMDSVALYVTSCLISGPTNADVANPQSIPVNITLPKLLKSNNVNVRLFIAAAAVIAVIWVLSKTALGYKIRTARTNPVNVEYIGANPREVFIRTMMFNSAVGGLADCIEVLGAYGYFLNSFATDPGTNGVLASLIIKNSVVTIPFIASPLVVLRFGALDAQQDTGVSRSIVDTITVTFIIVATTELLFQFNKKHKVKADAQ